MRTGHISGGYSFVDRACHENMDFKHKKIRKTNNTINKIGKKEPSKIVFAIIVSYLVQIKCVNQSIDLQGGT